MPFFTVSLLVSCLYGSAAGGVMVQEFAATKNSGMNIVFRTFDAFLDGIFWPATLAINANRELNRTSREVHLHIHHTEIASPSTATSAIAASPDANKVVPDVPASAAEAVAAGSSSSVAQ